MKVITLALPWESQVWKKDAELRTMVWFIWFVVSYNRILLSLGEEHPVDTLVKFSAKKKAINNMLRNPLCVFTLIDHLKTRGFLCMLARESR